MLRRIPMSVLLAAFVTSSSPLAARAGDQGRAVLLQSIERGLDLDDHAVDLRRYAVEEIPNGALLFKKYSE